MIYELDIPGTPPSVNRQAVGSGAGWWKYAKQKKAWEGDIFIALLAAKVPKGLNVVRATAVLRFPSKRKRDEGNYRAFLEKVLGDALQLGWLIDDTPEHFTFGVLTFDPEKGKARTLVTLDAE